MIKVLSIMNPVSLGWTQGSFCQWRETTDSSAVSGLRVQAGRPTLHSALFSSPHTVSVNLPFSSTTLSCLKSSSPFLVINDWGSLIQIINMSIVMGRISPNKRNKILMWGSQTYCWRIQAPGQTFEKGTPTLPQLGVWFQAYHWPFCASIFSCVK